MVFAKNTLPPINTKITIFCKESGLVYSVYILIFTDILYNSFLDHTDYCSQLLDLEGVFTSTKNGISKIFLNQGVMAIEGVGGYND